MGHSGPQQPCQAVFPITLGATFHPVLPIPLPPLAADAPGPAQSLEKEKRRAGTTGMGALNVITRA